MSLAQEYVDELYYNRSCGQFLNEDSYFERLFSALDVEDAYTVGQEHPTYDVIVKIFDLNKSYLDACRATNSLPNSEGRINYISQNL